MALLRELANEILPTRRVTHTLHSHEPRGLFLTLTTAAVYLEYGGPRTQAATKHEPLGTLRTKPAACPHTTPIPPGERQADRLTCRGQHSRALHAMYRTKPTGTAYKRANTTQKRTRRQTGTNDDERTPSRPKIATQDQGTTYTADGTAVLPVEQIGAVDAHEK